MLFIKECFNSDNSENSDNSDISLCTCPKIYLTNKLYVDVVLSISDKFLLFTELIFIQSYVFIK